MKQKFTLHIADLQLSVIADAAPEEVERISGILDRKMREIYLKSRCPKTEAALLCALEMVAERLGQQAEVVELEERCDKYAIVLENLKARNEENEAELERLRQENDVLRSLISGTGEAPIAPDPIPPTAFFTEVADAQTDAAPKSVEVSAPAVAAQSSPSPVEEPLPEESPAPVETPKPADSPRSRSRVGSMFDLLSFDEVD